MKYLVFALLMAAPAAAQQNCGPRAEVMAELVGRFGEGRISVGINGAGTVLMEVWANPETGTWTITEMNADSVLCVRAAGDNFEMVQPEPQGDPA